MLGEGDIGVMDVQPVRLGRSSCRALRVSRRWNGCLGECPGITDIIGVCIVGRSHCRQQNHVEKPLA